MKKIHLNSKAIQTQMAMSTKFFRAKQKFGCGQLGSTWDQRLGIVLMVLWA